MSEGKKRKVSWRKGRQFPDEWASGPDEFLHALWRKFLVARNQARYWGQDWRLTWEQYCGFFKGVDLSKLGVGRFKLNLVRQDYARGWEMGNVQLSLREKMFSRGKLPKGQRKINRIKVISSKKNIDGGQ